MKKTLKSILLWVLTLCMLLSLAACNNGSAGNEDPSGTGTQAGSTGTTGTDTDPESGSESESESESEGGEIVVKKTTYRVLLVSDMHYTVMDLDKNQYPYANPSAAATNAFGYTQRQKIEKIYEAIMAENNKENKEPLDLVLILGDLSLDDCGFRNLPTNFCKQLKTDLMDRLPCPSYAIPGNHDPYYNVQWKQIFGYNRQYTIELGDNVFIMLDNFNNFNVTGGSGSPYTPVDVEFLEQELTKHAGKKIFLCAHYFDYKNESAEFKRLVKENKDILCLFDGHSHSNGVTSMGDEYGNKYRINIGGYAYNGQLVNGKYDFNIFDEKWAWGYQMLEIKSNMAITYHNKPAYTYYASNGTFNYAGKVSGYTILPVMK